ncbi:hypothetical protein GCM10029978_010960 [Actinoallomurus acanthiterrae]
MGSDTSRRSLLRLLTAGGAVAAVPLAAGCDGRSRNVVGASAHDGESAVGADTVMIIRHGEKPPSKGAPFGVTEDGQQNDGSLTVRGWQRAGALVDLFAPQKGSLRAGLVRPATIYAAQPNGDKGLRHSETITPLAARLGLQPKLSYGKGDEAALGKKLASAHGNVLVCWEHSAIPDIVAAMGAVHPKPPAKWAGKRFDVVWVFTRDGKGWRFSQVPQLVLPGDVNSPIA